MVTGRRLNDLKRVFPTYEVFDHIVAENGALIYHVKTGEEILLASPPPDNFISSLQLKNVIPLEIGKIIVATREPHQNTVLDSIKECGLEWQVIFNKGAVYHSFFHQPVIIN
ncbi:hypothetical protein [Pinibacter aurantiacus]|uniref:Uncharacterized protein n=1 Tax=Pinibacter aurantiacus TaxID=2851599 RepID=A0A9E2W795_9BACT|nr:hypothetical protein [Pinibacter aurantiacus]MBV4355847.1 hypothetical protein [Pinibacter aurantiacus]